MRRSTCLGIALLSCTVALGALNGFSKAQERSNLSAWFGRLLKNKQAQPAEAPAEAPAETQAARPATTGGGWTARGQSATQIPPVTARQEPEAQAQSTAQVSPASEREESASASPAAVASPARRSTSIPYPPLPPRVDQAWVHPPAIQELHTYTIAEALALTRARVGRQTIPPASFARTTRTATVLHAESSSAASPAFPATSAPSGGVRQVSHVRALVSPASATLPVETLPVETLPAATLPVEKLSDEQPSSEPTRIGNTPAEVRIPLPTDRTHEEPDEVQLVSSVKPMELTPAAQANDAQPRHSPIVSAAPPVAPVFHKVRGRIAEVNQETGLVLVDLAESESLPVGTKIRVYHETKSGEPVAVHVTVLESTRGVAAAKLIDGAASADVAPGDQIIAWKSAKAN